MLDGRAVDRYRELGHRPWLGDQRILLKLRNGQGDGFVDGFRVDAGRMIDSVGVNERYAAESGGHADGL